MLKAKNQCSQSKSTDRSEWNRDWVGGPLKDHCGLKWKTSTEAVYRQGLSRLYSLSKLRSRRFPASQLW